MPRRICPRSWIRPRAVSPRSSPGMASRRRSCSAFAGRGVGGVPSFGRLLMAAPLEPDDVPKRRAPMRRRRSLTRYLVDTNVISAAAPTAVVRRPELVRWMDSHSHELFLSAISIAEIADGIAKAKRGVQTPSLVFRMAADCRAIPQRPSCCLTTARPCAGVLSDLARGRGHAQAFLPISPRGDRPASTT